MSQYKPKPRDLPLNGAAWRRIRADVLAIEPLCRHCSQMGIVRAAEHVDHIDNTKPNLNTIEALQALCAPCHSRKTIEDIHGKRFGFDEFGNSLDPNSGWSSKDR